MKVALLMGSDSDLPRLQPALERLAELEIEHEARVLSAAGLSPHAETG